MSGGKFDYIQYRFTDIIEDIKKEVENSGLEKTDEEIKNEGRYWDPEWYEKYPEDKFHTEYSPEILVEFENAISIIAKAQIYIQRIDYLLSGDDGEESFIRRLKNDLDKLNNQEA